MSDSTLQDIINELVDAEAKLNARITQLFGKVETTDFAAAYNEFQDAINKLKAFTGTVPAAPGAGPETGTPAA